MPLLVLGSVRWRKVWRDLFEHRVRSVLVVLSIAVGVTASPTVLFLTGGNETGQRLTGEDIKRTDLKARVEAMLPPAAPA